MAISVQRAGAAGYADDAESLSPGKRLPRDGNGKAPRVLIVDDDPASRMLCSLNLKIENLVVLEAADGGRALEQARSERPDLVVTDVMMPGLDGFQLAEALRRDEQTREIPLIFLSAETNPANEARARELGALAYLTKPFDPPVLFSLVAGALARVAKHEATDGASPRQRGRESPPQLSQADPPRSRSGKTFP